jgi:hypothetical protein
MEYSQSRNFDLPVILFVCLFVCLFFCLFFCFDQAIHDGRLSRP